MGLIPQRAIPLDLWGMGTNGKMLPSSVPWADSSEVHSTWLLGVSPGGVQVLTVVASCRTRPWMDLPSCFNLPSSWTSISQNEPTSRKPLSFLFLLGEPSRRYASRCHGNKMFMIILLLTCSNISSLEMMARS